MAEVIEPTTLRNSIVRAVRRVYENDPELVREGTHERTVLFHVGRHLAAEVDTWNTMWRVDLEYDRFHRDELGVVRKYLGDTAWRRGGRVVPDLIVHDRRESSPEANLLVLEAKLRPKPWQRQSELHKLAAYLSELRYQHAVYLEFPAFPAIPRMIWVRRAQDVASDTALAPAPMWET